MILSDFIEVTALSYYTEGAYTQAQIAKHLSEDPLVPQRHESAYKRVVTRLQDIGLIELVDVQSRQYGCKFYRITPAGKDEMEQVGKLCRWLGFCNDTKNS